MRIRWRTVHPAVRSTRHLLQTRNAKTRIYYNIIKYFMSAYSSDRFIGAYTSDDDFVLGQSQWRLAVIHRQEKHYKYFTHDYIYMICILAHLRCIIDSRSRAVYVYEVLQ